MFSGSHGTISQCIGLAQAIELPVGFAPACRGFDSDRPHVDSRSRADADGRQTVSSRDRHIWRVLFMVSYPGADPGFRRGVSYRDSG